MSATLVVDPGDPTPPYEQVRRQLLDLIATGELLAGDRLPPLRQLAADLGLAVGTVARAYRELEAAGWLESRRGGGTRVARRVPAPRPSTALADLARGYVERARALGFTADEAALAVRDAWAR